LVILGIDEPYDYNGIVYMRTVGRGLDALITRLQGANPYKLQVHAWAPIKDTKLVNRFLRGVKSVKRAHIHGHWFHVEGTDIVSAIGLINGDVVFADNHRLAYLKDAVVTVPEWEGKELIVA